MTPCFSHKQLKIIIVLAVITSVATVPAKYLAYWWALSGHFDCAELGCGLLAELILWPALFAALLVGVAILTALIWKRRGLT